MGAMTAPRTIATLAALVGALALAGCGEKAEPDLAEIPPPPPALTTPTVPTTTTTAPKPPDGGEKPPNAGGNEDPGQPGGGPRALAIERAVGAYVGGLDARNGRAVCELFVPGALGSVKFPRERGSCPATLRASIGYADPRGLPVWEGAKVASLKTKVSRNDARAVVTVVTRFADRNQPSVEDDVIYLARSGRLWKIAKPSATLYRAVGIADVPPSVLSPP